MTKNNSAVHLHFLSNFALDSRGKLKAFISSGFKKEGIKIESINIVFCDDNYLLKLNQQFLNHDFYTDILSFRLSPLREPLIGEIYISIDRVRDNAKNLNSSFRMELHRVIFHGILHFCGYKDKSPKDLRAMRSMEDRWLSRYWLQLQD
jgi:probable rRNA maturation factor